MGTTSPTTANVRGAACQISTDLNAVKGVISHIQHFSLHDGPGIRTTVFLKGCQMRCAWCHNPETYHRTAELQLFNDRCIGCGVCIERCAQGAHEIVGGQRIFHRDLCNACGRCAETCYAQALVIVGETKTAGEVVEEVLADRAFYESSGGGVTISGGEPLVQPEFTGAVLQRCRQEGVHTAIETNLAMPWLKIAALLPVVDLFCVDVKLLDDAEHKRWTGVSNRLTLDNLRRLDQQHKAIIVRTPVIAGLNDGSEQIQAIVDWLAPLSNVLRYDLLPYHPLGTGKYRAVGLAPPPEWFGAPAIEHFKQLQSLTRQKMEIRRIP